MTGSDRGELRWTIPNVLSGVRLLGVIPLVWVAYSGHRLAFLAILLALLITDWLDGELAKLLEQRTALGARLDSAADVSMYAAVAVCFWWLEGDTMLRHAWWFSAVGVTWVVSAMVSLARFGRLPSYHSWGAKVSWMAVALTAVYWLLTGDGAAVPWTLSLVILTNVEAVAIGAVLHRWRADVPSLWHALRMRRAGDQPLP